MNMKLLKSGEKIKEGWQFKVYVYEDYVVKKRRNFEEIRKKVKEYRVFLRKDTKNVSEQAQKVLDDVDKSIKIVKNSNCPLELLGYPEFLENGDVKQRKATVLYDKLLSLVEEGKIKEIKVLIDDYVKLVLELWKYGIYEKVYKFHKNSGIISERVVLLDFFELTDNPKEIENNLEKKKWKVERWLDECNFSDELKKYFNKKCSDNFTIEKFRELWSIK